MDKEAHDAWHVREHGPIEKLADNLWRVQGSLPGMSLRRTMTVVRRRSGELVIHSAIALENAALRELESWGTPCFLLIPNRGHTLDAAAYRKRYPAIKVFTPRGGVKQVEAKIHGPVSGDYEAFPSDEEVRLSTLHGVADGEGVMLVRSTDGLTVVLNDCVMNMDKKQDLLGYLFTTLMGSAPGPRISRFAKLMFIKDQSALRRDLLGFAALPDVKRLIVAHEKLAEGPEARRALERAANFLHA